MKDRFMRFGLTYDFRNPAGSERSDQELYTELLDQIVLAENLGYDEVWLTEHHFTDDGYNPSVLPMAAAIAARTSTIRIGTFVLVLPFHDPLRVAEDATCVDLISNGRLDLGVGIGYTADEYATLGLDRTTRGARMEEGLELIQRLWTEDRVTLNGKFNQLNDARLTPRPVQDPHPPLWIGARAGKAIERAARLGANLLTTIGPDPTPDYVEALKRHGRDPADYEVGQLRLAYCAPTEDQAWEEVAGPLHTSMSYYGRVMGETPEARGDESVWRFNSPAEIRNSGLGRAATIGTPDQVAARLESWLDTHHCTQIICSTHLAGMDPNMSSAAMELFATEVMPRFK
jgi:alkanesulfonate monooxygenase SsuD/methylene tetrahydromethanopterin reductase-like flavin-dependent oxidoreductase (luciferase family)